VALTRAILETIITKRVGALMEAAGMIVTTTGVNYDLHDPLAWANRMVGGTSTYASTVEDADLAKVAAADYDDFIDLAEYRTLKNILGNLDDVDITAGPRSEKLSQLADHVQKMVEARQPFVDGFSRSPTAGYISMAFAEHGE